MGHYVTGPFFLVTAAIFTVTSPEQETIPPVPQLQPCSPRRPNSGILFFKHWFMNEIVLLTITNHMEIEPRCCIVRLLRSCGQVATITECELKRELEIAARTERILRECQKRVLREKLEDLSQKDEN